jgi:hypothetical protein
MTLGKVAEDSLFGAGDHYCIILSQRLCFIFVAAESATARSPVLGVMPDLSRPVAGFQEYSRE